MYETLRIILAQVPVVCLGEVLFRLVVQLPQEVFCHNVDLRRAVKSVLSCPINCICFGIGSMLLGGMLCEYSWQSCIPFLGVYLVGRLGGICQSPMMEQLHFIRSDLGLDYGSGLASSYFFGYLKIVLPSTGEVASKNIKERMEDFEDSQLVKVPIKKLFILVPDSMYTPQSFSSDSMVISRNLEPLRVRRAGNVSRSYDNTMYKLTNTDWYAAIEGASPLQTVYESMEADPRLKHLRKEILASFVKALRRLLWDDLKCRNLCEVVQVNDMNDSGEDFDYGKFMKRLITEKLQE